MENCECEGDRGEMWGDRIVDSLCTYVCMYVCSGRCVVVLVHAITAYD